MTTESNSPFVAFAFPKRIGRLSYVLRLLALLALNEAVFQILYAFRAELHVWPPLYVAILSVYLVLFFVYLFLYVLLPRLLDFGLPSLAIIIYFIPVFNTLLVFGLMVAPRDYWQVIREKNQRTSDSPPPPAPGRV